MKTHDFALAACLSNLDGIAPSEIQLTLDGTFKAKDGRPANLDGWVIDAEIAAKIIENANAQSDKFCIDFDHATLHTQKTGAKAPAAGWYKNLEYREGLGIFATDVEWTESASLAIQAKEYRYISPVLQFNSKTGEVSKIIMASVVNVPALDSMKSLTALATDYFSQQQDSQMPEEIKALKAEIADLKKQLADSKAACSTDVETVDLSQYVPIGDVKEIQSQLVALSAQIQAKEIAETVEAALSDGRLLPAQKAWAENLGKSNIAALNEFVATAQPIAALSGTQTGGKSPLAPKAASNIKAPLGWQVDEEAAALHAEISAYSKQHGVDFTTAAIAVGA